MSSEQPSDLRGIVHAAPQRRLRVLVYSNDQSSSHSLLLPVLALTHHLLNRGRDTVPCPSDNPVPVQSRRQRSQSTRAINVNAEEWDIFAFCENYLLRHTPCR